MVSKNTQIRTQKKCCSTCKGVTPGPTHLKLTGSFKSSLSWSLLLSRLPRSAWRPTSLLWAAGSCKSYSTLSKKAGKVFLWTQLSTLPSPWYDRERFELITSHHLRQQNWLKFWEKPCFCVPWKRWPAAWISKPFVWLAPPSCNRTDLSLLLYQQLLEATKYYDDDDYSLLQPKAFFTYEFIQWRVLSIQPNPYQALR